MKEHLKHEKVKDVFVAISNDEKDIWNVYVLNKNNKPITNVLVSSKGYGNINDESKNTSTLRHLIEEIKSNSYGLVEPIDPSLFQLTNEFWVSFYIGKQIFDKKYIFTPASFLEENMINLPLVNKKGILHS